MSRSEEIYTEVSGMIERVDAYLRQSEMLRITDAAALVWFRGEVERQCCKVLTDRFDFKCGDSGLTDELRAECEKRIERYAAGKGVRKEDYMFFIDVAYRKAGEQAYGVFHNYFYVMMLAGKLKNIQQAINEGNDCGDLI